jgi:hypothetical protein
MVFENLAAPLPKPPRLGCDPCAVVSHNLRNRTIALILYVTCIICTMMCMKDCIEVRVRLSVRTIQTESPCTDFAEI